MIRMLVLALALVSAPSLARDRRPAAVPVVTLSDRLGGIAPGTTLVVATSEWDGGMARNALDVAFGPADADVSGRSVWHADGVGRDSSMRRAGIGRIVVLRGAASVTVVADRPALTVASR